MNVMQQVIGGKCPICNQEKVFSSNGNILLLKAPKMNDACGKCGHHYETEPGFFFGAMFVSYAFVVAELVLMYLLIFNWIETTEIQIGILFGTILMASFFNFKYSRLVWLYALTPNKTPKT
jgi:uncharacterized protein (DUF983 family)